MNIYSFNFFAAVIDTPSKDRCINNNNVRTPNGNHHYNHQQKEQLRIKGQHQSNALTMRTLEDGNVLKKVITFTLENNGEYATTPTTCKTTRPSFVPEKLHFSAYDQFEGEFPVQ